MNNKLFFSSARTGNPKRDKWQTPPAVFEKLNEEFHFTLDATAEPETALCDHYFTMDDDALTQDWSNQTVYCNPPYSKLKDFAKKAQEEADKGATVVMLVPARTDTKAFHDHLSHGEVRLIKGRLKFLQDGRSRMQRHFQVWCASWGKG
ncbi:phage N-6-adenine-methyltransferase [Vibrio chagasii]|uniref:phage N-6-adenine-methyltransferase n=1 Tax=Vibrio chagasii TaxID=170679 RepID=UPI003DA8F015